MRAINGQWVFAGNLQHYSFHFRVLNSLIHLHEMWFQSRFKANKEYRCHSYASWRLFLLMIDFSELVALKKAVVLHILQPL